MTSKTLAVALIAGLGLLGAVTTYSTLSAQDAVESAEPSGRLPTYYSEIVTQDQRLKIYTIQSGYNTKIEQLEAEIAKLEAAMKKEMEAVLTQPQLERLEELAKEDEIRRQKNEAAKRAAEKAASASGS
ncbi:hypothetical protein DTL21_08765 [Bremerella cremea]|uniref:Uncharacterized protein n=1 Tax=Blastopirellula marina TaxID=124 RepID=A0A2S8FV08_9BACT|nr:MULTISPECIES: hypothetical protein [Pirellulaceae]PQO36007.1 hypothetical protein C5Y83_08760 [Blastopirellula marina]RCS48684.1 hypothetical protein DTL21_08765 [Bremerella cremea]